MKTYAIYGKQQFMVQAIKSFFDNLQSDNDLKYVFEANCKNELDNNIRRLGIEPDILMVDIGINFLHSISDLAEVARSYPGLKIIAISDFTHEEAIVKILNAGASAILGKHLDPEVLHRLAIESINSIGINSKRYWMVPSEHLNLSQREIVFLQYCATELTYKEIADRMYVSTSTVNNYREALFSKLGIKNRVGLVLFGINSFLIDPFRAGSAVRNV
jgi:two-component system invasion response regulator UvrY